MELDLEPRFSQKIFGGAGGEYYSWSRKDFQLIAETKVGGGRLVLMPLGFALPHYADCSKIGYVLQGIYIHIYNIIYIYKHHYKS